MSTFIATCFKNPGFSQSLVHHSQRRYASSSSKKITAFVYNRFNQSGDQHWNCDAPERKEIFLPNQMVLLAKDVYETDFDATPSLRRLFKKSSEPRNISRNGSRSPIETIDIPSKMINKIDKLLARQQFLKDELKGTNQDLKRIYDQVWKIALPSKSK